MTDDAYQIAKTVAREQKKPLGKVVSEFITGRAGQEPAEPPSPEGEIFPSFRCIRRVTSEDVKALDDEE